MDDDIILSGPSEPGEELSIYLADSLIQEIVAAIRTQDPDTVNNFLKDLSAADTADLLAKIGEEYRMELLSLYGDSINPGAFVEMDRELCRSCLSELSSTQIASIISALESDDALGLLGPLDADVQRAVIRKLSDKTRLALEEGLSFPEHSAGRLMKREFVAIPQFWTVGKTIDYLRAASTDLPEEFLNVYVLSPSFNIIGEIPLNRLLRSVRTVKIEQLALDHVHTIPASMDQEEAAHIFRRENLLSAPVVDEEARMIGIITSDDIIDVIDMEAEEDILKMAGVDQGDLYRAAMSTTGARFRWLFINLLTAIAASIVISFFDGTIDQIVALAVLMPIVASMGGNAGTQTLTVAVRALATREISGTNMFRVIGKETMVGALNGIAFALITGAITALWFSDYLLGFVIAMAMVINLIVAGLFGAGIPILVQRAGGDPAISSTVLLTTVTDVVGFFAFLGLATLLMA